MGTVAAGEAARMWGYTEKSRGLRQGIRAALDLAELPGDKGESRKAPKPCVSAGAWFEIQAYLKGHVR